MPTATRRRLPTCSASIATRCAQAHKYGIRYGAACRSVRTERSICALCVALPCPRPSLRRCSRFGQDRRRRIRARARALGVRLLSTGGTARALPTPDSRSPRSATTPAFPRCSTAASRRCIRRCTAASSPAATSPRTSRARAARHPADRSGRRQPVSVPRDGREAGLHARGSDREHRHRRPGDGARRREELAARRRRRRPGRLCARCSTSCGERQRALGGDALRARAQGVRAHRCLRRRDRQLADRARRRRRGGRLSRSLQSAGDQGAGPALRREPAPARRVLSRERARRRHASRRTASCRARSCRTTTSPMPMPRGSASSVRATTGSRRLRHRQARQSVRGRAAGRCSTRTGKAFATDPTSAFGGIIAFNRPVDAATLEAVAAQFVEVLIAPGYTPDALAVIAQEERARAGGRRCRGAARRRSWTSSASAAAASCRRADTRDARRPTSRSSPRGADRRSRSRPAVRVARGEVRQVERDRLLPRRAARSASARAR